MAAEDHLSLANQMVGGVEGLLVFFCTRKVLLIQFFQARQEVTESSQDELAAVHPVRTTLTLPFNRRTNRPACHVISLHSLYTLKLTRAPNPILVFIKIHIFSIDLGLRGRLGEVESFQIRTWLVLSFHEIYSICALISFSV